MQHRLWTIALCGLAALGSFAAMNLGLGSSAPAGKWTVVAWNDLGMHCMDSDYTVFSILPPFNNVYAQLVTPQGQKLADPTGFSLTYEAVADPTGSINKSSAGKTAYWEFAPQLYGGSSTPDTGLAGNNMPGAANTPQPMTWDASLQAFVAAGVPIVPFDDAGHKRTYPLMKIVARDSLGNLLASCTPVLPVSDELDCRACHGSGTGPDAKPAAGWVFDANSERDFRLNVLRLHDEKQQGNPAYASALALKGFSALGLHDTVVSQHKSVLCASCHASNALPGTGLAGIAPLTESVHAGHAQVLDPTNGLTLDAIDNRAACYRCHPGSQTKCLRGAMGTAVGADGELAMQCQSCHGNMSKVGEPTREGWLDEPNCQACHTGTATKNNGQIVYTDAFGTNGELRVAVDPTFATNPNTPAAPYSLYKLSKGHGGLMCEACHGSTHAEFPGLHPNDNLVSTQVQGHSGMLAECSACHSTSVPFTTTGGPHGMHTIGQAWVNGHPSIVEQQGAAKCAACHGSNYKGTILSQAQDVRTLSTNFGTKNFFNGARIGCYDCHNGPSSESANPNHKPVASNGAMLVENAPQMITLVATDSDGNALSYRIVTQPPHGRVGLVGKLATYVPDPGFAGVESFSFAANDGQTDSNLGLITVTRGANTDSYGYGYAGKNAQVPAFSAFADPKLGTSAEIVLGNSSQMQTLALLVVSPELANQPTGVGGALLTEPQVIAVLSLPAAGATLLFQVPNDPLLTGATYYAQAIEFDALAPFGFSFTRGLRLTLGL